MAGDNFERYYKEKLWETIPSIYRHEDGIADNPGVLEAIVKVIANQAAILRRSQDQLWDDQFIERCNEWAIPYIGDLLATHLLSALNKRGRRIDVAKTIYYRRRKGTPRILEELIYDVSMWNGKMTEQFQKLARARHGLDPFPGTLTGRFSGTLPGGIADLRNPRISELINGPFEEYFHIPDMRRHQGLNGRYNITKLAFYLYRLRVYEAVHVTPFPYGDDKVFSFDPSGRKIPLFSKSIELSDWDEWRDAFEWELPAPIPCRLLAHAEYKMTEAIIQELLDPGSHVPSLPVIDIPFADQLRKIVDLPFKDEYSLRTFIDTLVNAATIVTEPLFLRLISLSLVHDCGKASLLPDNTTTTEHPLDTSSIMVEKGPVSDRIVYCEDIVAANLNEGAPDTIKKLAIDAEHGCFSFKDPQHDVAASYCYGFSADIGAGFYKRSWATDLIPDIRLVDGGPITTITENGITQIDDSKSYGPIDNRDEIVNMLLLAANEQRPYLRLENNWELKAKINAGGVTLVLDGLWIGAAGGTSAEIILQGNYKCVTIRNCTLDPGNTGTLNIKGEAMKPVLLTIQGIIQNLCIESCILGPIQLDTNGKVEELSISDSIVQSTDATVNAMEIKSGKTWLYRTTVFGAVKLQWLYASETLITGDADITDTQGGCFRFSAALEMKSDFITKNRLPHPYESFLFPTDSNHWFMSRDFGNPGFAQLSDTAPEELKRGAENQSEMGAFSLLLNPIKFDGLKSKIEEYMPFGLIPIFVNKT